MGVWEVIILLIFLGSLIWTMYYCYFQKMKRIEESFGLDYREQAQNRCFQRDGTRPHDGEIYTITTSGIILRETRADLSQCTVVRRDSKVIDLPPSYDEAVKDVNNSRSVQTAQTSQTAQSVQTSQTTSAPQ